VDQAIEHVAVLFHGPPQIVTFTLDRQKHFVHVPLITGPRPSATQLISILLAKLATPLANGLIGHDHAAFKQ